MARRQVLEIHCDRCGRLENQVPDSPVTEKEFSLTFRGNKVTFQDLCGSCRKSLANYVQRIAKGNGKTKEPPAELPDKKNRT